MMTLIDFVEQFVAHNIDRTDLVGIVVEVPRK